MVGRGHCRAAVGIRARHGIVTSGVGMQGVGGRGKRGAAPLPHIGAGTRSRESSLRAATFGCRTRDGYRGGTIDGHCGRGSVGTAETVGTRHAVSARLGNREGIIGCCSAIRPAVILLSGGAVRRKGGRSTSVHGSVGAVVDGNGRQGFHIHESGGCSRTTVRASTGYGILGLSHSRCGDGGRSLTAQVIAPGIGLSITRNCHCGIRTHTRGINTIVVQGDSRRIGCKLDIIVEIRIVVMPHINGGLVAIGSRGLGDFPP